MQHLQINWKSRTVIILMVSLIISVLMVSLELTTWAEQINQQGALPHGDGKGKGDIPSILRYILPFVKEILLIGVPLFITLAVLKLSTLLKRVVAKKRVNS